MKALLRILKWFFLGILLLVVIGLGWIFGMPWVAVIQDDMSSGKYITYLEDHHFSVDPAAPEFAFPPDFYDHDVFLLAEMHGYAAVQDFDLNLLRHLNENAGVRYYLAELDPAQALAANWYLESGDDQYLREVFDIWSVVKAQWANKEFFAKFEKIRALNENLPDDRKIYFIGVDEFTDRTFAERILRLAVGVDEATPIAEISAMLSDDMRRGDAEMPGYGWLFPDYASSSTPAFWLNAQLTLAGLDRPNDARRYDHILANISIVQDTLTKGTKLYGLWGIFHGMQAPVEGREPLAMRLEALEEGDQVVTLGTLYADFSKNMMPAEALPDMLRGKDGEEYSIVPANNDDTYLYYNRGIKDLKKVAGDAPVTVFNIDADESPYRDTNRLVAAQGFMYSLQPFGIEGSAADAYEYVVLFQRSPALTPWKGRAYDVAPDAE